MTKRSQLSRTALAAALAVVAGGCGDGLTELNRNPNEPTEVGADYLLANALEASVSRTLGSSLNMDVTGLWIQHYAEARYATEDVFELSDATVRTHWSGYYAGPLQDFNEVAEQGRTTSRPNVEAMGRILQSWTFQVVTDLWGDVGYSEALRGRDASASLTVKYDPQQQVYAGILSELKAAQAQIQPTGVALGTSDLLYRSDMARWRKFANSLRLRTAMRMSKASEATARTEFAAALGDGVFTSNADNAVFQYLNDGVNVHPIFAYQRSQDVHRISATLVDTLKHMGDPRLAVYATPNARGVYRGVANGDLREVPLDSVSKIGTHFSRADAPAVIMSYAEVLLLQAEAAARGWIPGDPAALYRQALTAHMQQLGVSAADIATFLAQPSAAYGGLPSIALQKWIVLFGNGPEAFAEWRRTGFPVLRPGPDAKNDRLIPRRLPYPETEQSYNALNLKEAVDRQGGAGMNDRVWWDRA